MDPAAPLGSSGPPGRTLITSAVIIATRPEVAGSADPNAHHASASDAEPAQWAGAAVTNVLDRAIGQRHGLLPKPTEIPATPADVPGIFNWSVAHHDGDPWRTAGGGVGWDSETARHAAIAEAIERYSAVAMPLPIVDDAAEVRTIPLADFTLFSEDQIANPGFPHRNLFDDLDATVFTNAFTLPDHREVRVPAALVGLSDRFGALPTSSGLAIAPSAEASLLRATQEVIERDAYMTTWLHGLLPGRCALDSNYTEPVESGGGWVVAFDITPEYSSHAVAMVVGNLPLFGRPRLSLGLACRADWAAAADKAYLEWSQGVIFAGYRSEREPDLQFQTAQDVQTFDDHAVYYTIHPDRWADLPLMADAAPVVSPRPVGADPSLGALVRQLQNSGIELIYRDLTMPDVAQLGLTVVRVLAPVLTPIHADHRWPHLGGRTSDLSFRYPKASVRSCYPSPYPHPLG